MKKAIMLLSVMCVAVSLLLLPSQVAASTVTLRVSQLQGNLTAALRERAAHLGPADHLVLYFDRAARLPSRARLSLPAMSKSRGWA